jgi:hypothetical protein
MAVFHGWDESFEGPLAGSRGDFFSANLAWLDALEQLRYEEITFDPPRAETAKNGSLILPPKCRLYKKFGRSTPLRAFR